MKVWSESIRHLERENIPQNWYNVPRVKVKIFHEFEIQIKKDWLIKKVRVTEWTTWKYNSNSAAEQEQGQAKNG